MKAKILLLIGLIWWANDLAAQGFGRNKPRYNKMDFEVLETPHFEINHYLKNDSVLTDFANWSEQWYEMHQSIMKDTFYKKNPIVLYNDHADFQQTRAIGGMIGIGTGGVTEGLRNRVVLPFAMSNQQTHHVLGHELVHAFQYKKILNNSVDTSLSSKNLQNIPLWMIEGMAEYLSIGREDSHTAMWMRDAVLQDDIPTLKKLSDPSYFPYRYGQAFWAFVAGTYGDTIVEPLFVATAKYGLETALDSVLHVGHKNFSSMWQSALKTYYEPFLGDKKEARYGRKILDDENAGEMNISPVLSPDGKYVIFLSEKNLFTTDLFLADARTGKIIRKVASTVRDGHLDNLDFIESAGTWSPDSRYFAFVAYKKGRNVLVIKDVSNGKTVKEVAIPTVPAFNNPTWAPTGNTIVVSGLVEGQIDLYAFDWVTEKTERLTNDRFSELHPHWSKDGKLLAFSTDELSMKNGRHHGEWTYNLAVMNMDSRSVQHYNIFPGANNLNPVFDRENDIWFLSNRDGFRNIYQLETATGNVFQKTRFLIGVSGITQYSPALSIAGNKFDRVIYSYYGDGKYTIFQGKPDRFLHEPVDPNAVDMRAGILPVVYEGQADIVGKQLNNLDNWTPLPDSSFHERPYQSKLGLEYVGGGAGIGVGQQTFGTTTAMQGGVDLLFGDMLGDRKLYTGISLNGEIYDFAGVASYLNQENKFGWGASLSHIPYRSAGISYVGLDTLRLQGLNVLADKYHVNQYRMFEEQASVFGQLPFSQTNRVEAGFGYSRIHYRLDQFTNYYDAFGRLLYQEREKLDAPEGFGYFSVNTAFVHDNSFFGIAAPLQGNRYRVGVQTYLGDLNFYSLIADYRQYLYAKPFSFAFRAMHLGRYGKDAEALTPIYLGYPWFVRGYNYRADNILAENQISINQLIGSKVLVGNFEIRLPFTGPERLSVIPSKFLFTDLNLFLDAGMAWNGSSDFDGNENVGIFKSDVRPVFSAGTSVRINLFGAMVLEPYWAVPLMDKTSVIFGMNIVPGW